MHEEKSVTAVQGDFDLSSISPDFDGLDDSPIAMTVRETLVEPRQSEDFRKFDNCTPPPVPGNW
ncbi:MAG: hypothetical protein HOY71_54460 [Nonomuraea sp.]|nr:hypothetical protein [Nonomuraea sp.]